MSEVTEDDIYAAAQRLGEATRGCTEAEREILRKLYADVKDFAAKQQEKGVHIDRSAFFAAGIIFHPEIENEDLINAAVDYVDKDYLFVKGSKDETEAAAPS